MIRDGDTGSWDDDTDRQRCLRDARHSPGSSSPSAGDVHVLASRISMYWNLDKDRIRKFQYKYNFTIQIMMKNRYDI